MAGVAAESAVRCCDPVREGDDVDHPEENRRIEPGLPVLADRVDGLIVAVEKGLASQFAPFNLSSLEVRLLRFCLERGECTATELADVLPIDPARISRTVKRLFDMGFLVRRRLPNDRRVVMLSLSEEGNERLGRILDNTATYLAALTEGVSEEEMRAFNSVAAKIIANYHAL